MILARLFLGVSSLVLFSRGMWLLLIVAWLVLCGWVGLMVFDGEFDPGSGRTLAACLTHASRAERPLRWYSSGERVSNTWVICPGHRNNPWKRGLMPDDVPALRGQYQR